jgi:indole-3-glycerol phosphate synthase
MTILDEIAAYKRTVEIPANKMNRPIELLMESVLSAPPPLDIIQALKKHRYPALIAEIKKASPSKGLLCPDLDPVKLAAIYSENGASAISILTDERYFQGGLEILRHVRSEQGDIPLLRKDFIVDEYQIVEARAAGADALLLIAAILADSELEKLLSRTEELGMAALIEVHDADEMERVIQFSPDLIGVNNRDLHNFSVDIRTSQRLRSMAPKDVCYVAESGIHSWQDVETLYHCAVDAVLVGEALVTAENIGEKVRELSAYDLD